MDAKAAECTKARCKLCKKDFNLSKLVINALELHSKRQKHQQRVKEADEVATVFAKTKT